MRLRNALLYLGISVLIGLNSCKKDLADREKPSIVAFNVPADSATVSGNTLHIEAVFSDNHELAQYKLIIKPSDEAFVPIDSTALLAWNLTRIWDVTGNSTTVSQDISIPDSIATGWYELMLNVVDASGNLSPTDTQHVFIQSPLDTQLPTLLLQWPADLQYLSNTSTLTVNADASDNVGISAAVFKVYGGSTQVHSEIQYPASNPASLTFNFPLSGLSNGLYRFELTLYDKALNSRQEQRNFVVQD